MHFLYEISKLKQSLAACLERIYQRLLMCCVMYIYTTKNYDLFKVVENRMQQCCAAHIVHSCQQHCSALLHLIQAASGSTMLNNIVDNHEQCGQHNIVASCFQQP